MKPHTPLAVRFEARIQRTSGCWLWTGSKLPRGYGVIGAGGRGGRHLYAHRVAWELTSGPIPDGLFVCHHCDNPSCVRPDHLFLGTAKDNDADCRRKGREAPVEATRHQGESNGRARITDADALAIREAYWALKGKVRVRRGSLTALAKQYGISGTMVNYIARSKNWSHV